jgi:hypothetical protein
MKATAVAKNYKAVVEGRLAKGEFVRQMRQQFPDLISQFNGYDDTVQILKNKQVIFESTVNEAFNSVKIYDDRPALTYSLDVLERGIMYELQAAGLMTHDKFNIKGDDYFKAEKKAKENLGKDANHYINLIAGESKKVDKHDKEIEVKRGDGKIDVFNGLKKADLKEAKAMLKEGKLDDLAAKLGVDVTKLRAAADKIRDMERTSAEKDAKKLAEVEKALSDEIQIEAAPEMSLDEKKLAIGAIIDIIKSKYPDISQGIALDFIKTHYNDLIAGADPIEEFEEYVSVNTDYVDEKKGKDHDGDGDIDGDDYMAAKDKAIKQAMGKDEQLKEAIKIIIKQTLTEDAINEAATKQLADWGEGYSSFPGVKSVVMDLENIVTEVEAFYEKVQDKIAKTFAKTSEFTNEEGLKIGAFIAPSLEAAFKQDLRPVLKKGFTQKVELPKVKQISQQDVNRGYVQQEAPEEPKQTVFGLNEKKK